MQTVLVVDFGAQYAQLIARRPAGIILSGGPKSVYEPGAPGVDPALFEMGVPMLGICYGQQVMARALGGEVAHSGVSEFGKTDLQVTAPGSVLFGELPLEQTVWMSHRDAVIRPPDGFRTTASTPASPAAG